MLFSPRYRILVPIDFSEPSLQVQETVMNFVDSPSQVHILHVLAPLHTTDPGVVWQTVSDRQRIDQVKHTFHQRFNDRRYEEITLAVVVGNPSLKIVDYAREHGIQCIAIASHGRTGMARLLMGSVAERVVRLAPCSVLVMKGMPFDFPV